MNMPFRIAVGVTILAALYELFSTSPRKVARVDKSSESLILDAPLMLKISSVLMVFAATVAAYTLLTGSVSTQIGIVALGAGLVLAAVNRLIFISTFYDKYALNNHDIRWHRAWRHDVSFAWDEVTTMHYSRFLAVFVIRSDSSTIWFPAQLNGLRDFAEMVVAHVPAAKWAKAKRKIDKLLAANEGI